VTLTGRFHQEDVAVTAPSKYWLAAALGLSITQVLAADEPARLGVPSAPTLTTRLPFSHNQQVASTIAELLRQSGQLRRYDVDISFRDGVAELTGTVTDQLQREEVLRIVQDVPGVDRIRDRMSFNDTGAVMQAQAVKPVGPAGPDLTPVPKKEAGPEKNGLPVEPTPIYQAPAPPYDLNPPKMPPYAWPTYAPYNNFSRVAYPQLYPYKAWPFIGPMYPFPKVPLGWRSVRLQWQDGHWWYSKTATGHDWWRVRYW
jgi:hypothetical protein